MLYLFLFVIILLFLCKTQENMQEITPYSHKSILYPNYKNYKNYKKYCNSSKRKCLNTRCIYDKLIDCQDNCKTGCFGCVDNKFSCNIQ